MAHTGAQLSGSGAQLSGSGAQLSGSGARAPLESVSLCTRFSGFSTISSFGFNRLSSKLIGMFFGIVPIVVLKDFVRD